MTSSITIATRESPLALWQANWVRTRLELLYPDLKVTILGLKTTADKMLDISLTKVGGKGLFVKELEEALLNKKADIAVHSMKDVPMELPKGLTIPVMCEREDCRDVLVSNQFYSIKAFPEGSRLGTSSLRRQSQLNMLRSDLKLINLRGNVNTRLEKLDRGDFDGLILAAAGLIRLGLKDRIRYYFTMEELLPACGQGVLGIECREEDDATQELIAPLNHWESFQCVTAERALCRRLGGGCSVPISAFAKIDAKTMTVNGLVASPDGRMVIKAIQTNDTENPEGLGSNVAFDLLQKGAGAILKSLNS